MTRLALALLLLTGPALADEPEVVHVPLAENFSRTELDVGIVEVGALAFSFGFQEPLTSGKRPWIGAPPGFDRDISDALYRGPGAGKWLGGVPDVAGILVLPAAAIAFYGGDAIVFAFRGRGFTGDTNADHKFFAFAEAYLTTMSLNQMVKLGVGRERPEYYFDRPDADPRTSDAAVSFYSGHSTSSFCLAAFVHRDLSDWLVDHGAGVVEGRVLPGVVLYGAAGTIALSRIIDQKHYLSDVLVGAATGALFGNLFYALHFDSHGHPRRRLPHDLTVGVMPGGLSLAGTF